MVETFRKDAMSRPLELGPIDVNPLRDAIYWLSRVPESNGNHGNAQATRAHLEAMMARAIAPRPSIRMTLEFVAVDHLGRPAAALGVVTSQFDQAQVGDAVGQLWVGVAMAINDYMRANGAPTFNCLTNLQNGLQIHGTEPAKSDGFPYG